MGISATVIYCKYEHLRGRLARGALDDVESDDQIARYRNGQVNIQRQARGPGRRIGERPGNAIVRYQEQLDRANSGREGALGNLPSFSVPPPRIPSRRDFSSGLETPESSGSMSTMHNSSSFKMYETFSFFSKARLKLALF